MNWKKIGSALLFPHISVLIMLLPISTVFLVYSMVFSGTDSITAIISYFTAFYTLVIWCFRIPRIIKFFKSFKSDNKYAKMWLGDPRFRVNVSLYGTLIWNTAYGVFQLGLGFWHRSFWFYSLAAYYISLAGMRFYLVRHTRKHGAGEMMLAELKKYRACGVVFLVMNLALSLMVFFMVYWNRTFVHHEITTIALAAYTFTAFTFAVINIVKYRKYNSPVYSATKAISLASACVSMLTLESTMFTTFGEGSIDELTRKLFLGLSGGAVSIVVIVMALYMIVNGTKKIKSIKYCEEKING